LRVFELCYGKPAETAAIDSMQEPINIREMTSEERAVLIRRVLDDNPHLAELIPKRLRALHE
jgi:hypothetical protein